LKPTALLLSPEVPFPTIGGGALRTASIFEFLAERFALDVITFRQPGATDPRELFPSGRVRRLTVVDLPHHDKSLLPRVARNLKRAIRNRPPLLDRFSGFEAQIAEAVQGASYRLAVIEHFWCAPYEAQLRGVSEYVVLDLHNIESCWHGTLADSETGMGRALHRRFQMAYESAEQALLPSFDQLLVTSRSDADRVIHLAPHADCIVFPNTIPWVGHPNRTNREEIIFTGNLEYHPNISAVRYFKNQIWPKIRERCPNITWAIAGKNSHAIRDLVHQDSRIEVVGDMDDAVARIAEAKIAVVPLLAGSGTRIKILEAWAAGTPVVSTSLGAEGLEAVSGEHLMVADSAQDFSQAILELVDSAEERMRIGANGRQLFEKNYTCERAWPKLEHLKGVS
jgi:glycosyltransferase involved in cell wall biosynthesis